MAKKLWGGRFSEGTSSNVEAFSESVSIDSRLYAQDIRGSIAHARMLERCGILSSADFTAIEKGLTEIKAEIEAGKFEFDPALEDVHMNIESALAARIGDAGKRLHTARSRNDQVATDLRLYVRDEISELQAGLKGLLQALLDQAEAHVELIMPGMTHLQHAQPVSFGHHLLAYFEMFGRDCGRLADAAKRLNFSPLGAAALAGTPHPIDRHMTASELGFESPCRNSIDAVSDRDFALETLSACSIVMMHLSRLSEEIIIWNSSEFAFVDLPDSYCTGSSIMPQKKNPDVAELTRGKVGRVYGNLMNLLTTMKGLPLAYNRDMQEDKTPVIDTLDTVKICLDVMTGLVAGLNPRPEKIAPVLNEGFITATDVADYLVKKGVPFREAHHIVGAMVAELGRQNKRIDQLSLNEFKQFSAKIEGDILDVVTVAGSCDSRTSFGGTARVNVRAAVQQARAMFAEL